MKNRYDMFVVFANNDKAVKFVKAEDSEDIPWETEEEKKERLDREWRNPFG